MAEKKCNFLGRTESAAWKPRQEIKVGSVHEAGNDEMAIQRWNISQFV